jgi:hypothetical protein
MPMNYKPFLNYINNARFIELKSTTEKLALCIPPGSPPLSLVERSAETFHKIRSIFLEYETAALCSF